VEVEKVKEKTIKPEVKTIDQWWKRGCTAEDPKYAKKARKGQKGNDSANSKNKNKTSSNKADNLSQGMKKNLTRLRKANTSITEFSVIQNNNNRTKS